MYWTLKKWLHNKYGIHYWNRYNVNFCGFRTCYICEKWQKYSIKKRRWQNMYDNDKWMIDDD